MASYYRKQLEEYLSNLEIKAKSVLDVGGSQLPVRDRVLKMETEAYMIADLPSPHIEKAKPNFVLDLNDPQAIFKLGSAPKCEVVFCLEVMEYIYNPLTALSNLREMTENDGHLYISFPYYYPPHEPRVEDCLRYTLQGARKLLRLAGFETVAVSYREAKGHGFYMLNTENALRPSKTAEFQELNSLGFIIKAKAV